MLHLRNPIYVMTDLFGVSRGDIAKRINRTPHQVFMYANNKARLSEKLKGELQAWMRDMIRDASHDERTATIAPHVKAIVSKIDWSTRKHMEPITAGVIEAMNFLKIALASGPKHYRDVLQPAEEQGISSARVRRAAARLGVISKTTGWGAARRTIWHLPTTKPTPKHNPTTVRLNLANVKKPIDNRPSLVQDDLMPIRRGSQLDA